MNEMFQNALKTLAGNLLGRIITSSVFILFVTSCFAAVEEFSSGYGSYSYLVLFGVVSLICSIVWAIFALTYDKIKRTAFYRKMYRMLENKIAINPLDKQFHNIRIKMEDLRPLYSDEWVEHKIFNGCEIFGFAFVLLEESCAFEHTELRDCEFIEIDTNSVLSYNAIKIRRHLTKE